MKWKEIMKRWFRESRLSSIDKAVFPGLLIQLWEVLSSSDAVAGFRNSGIIPLAIDTMKRRVLFREETVDIPDSHNVKLTPKSALKVAIKETLQPSVSNETRDIVANKRNRVRVQAKMGEVLASEAAVRRLYLEEVNREKKKGCLAKPKVSKKNACQKKKEGKCNLKKRKGKNSTVTELNNEENDFEGFLPIEVETLFA